MAQYDNEQVKHADDFEWLAKEFMEDRFHEHFFLYGRSGQEQYGIDLFNLCKTILVQCKFHRQPGKFKRAVREDFGKALNHFTALHTFVIATSLERDTALQDLCDELMETAQKAGRDIAVEIYFRDDFERFSRKKQPTKNAVLAYARHFEEPLFRHKEEGKEITLRDLYVRPDVFAGENKLQIRSGDIAEAVRQFLTFDEGKDEPVQDRVKLLFIQGLAAYGKSSFASWLSWEYENRFLPTEEQAADSILGKRRLYVLRLRDFYSYINPASNDREKIKIDTGDVLGQICRLLRIDKDSLENSVLLLEGFDELCMLDEISGGQKNAYFRSLANQLKKLDCKAIITTRPNHLKAFDPKIPFIALEIRPFDEKKRRRWVEKFQAKQALDEATAAMLRDPEGEQWKALLDSPLSMYLVASSGISVKKDQTLWKLYNTICEQPFEREYADGPHETDSYRDALHALAGQIAHRMATSGKLYLNDGEVQELIVKQADKQADKQAVEQPDKLKKALGNIGLAVYFRKSGKAGECAVEFYHNSFRDYYLCEHLWAELEEIYRSLLKKEDPAAHLRRELTELFRNTEYLTDPHNKNWQVLEFLTGKLRDRDDGEDFVQTEQKNKYLPKFFRQMLERGMLEEFQYSEQDRRTALDVMDCVFSATLNVYLRIYRSFSKDERVPLGIHDYQAKKTFRAMIGQRSVWDLNGADLHGADLHGANLIGANLVGADLRGADLRAADLRGADLRAADLSGANLIGAYLRCADLCDANLRDADLRGADLHGAGLIGAVLVGANLSGADLRGAYLSDAYLRDADLRSVRTDERTDWGGAHFFETRISKYQVSYFRRIDGLDRDVPFSEAFTIVGD